MDASKRIVEPRFLAKVDNFVKSDKVIYYLRTPCLRVGGGSMEIREVNKILQKKQNINISYFVLILCFLLSILFYFKGFEGGLILFIKMIWYPVVALVALILSPFILPLFLFKYYGKTISILITITFFVIIPLAVCIYESGKGKERNNK